MRCTVERELALVSTRICGSWAFWEVINLVGGQLLFPGTQVPSTDAHTLDDYEEGTWTPTITGSGGASGQVYSAQLGRYVKIGKQVTCWGRVTLSTLGTVTGAVRIGGFPLTSANSGLPMSGSVSHFAAMTATFVSLGTYMHPNAVQAELIGVKVAATGVTALAQADLSNTSDIIFSVSYEAAA